MKRSTEIIIIRIAYVIFILLLASVALPSFIKPRNYVCQPACINNLRIIAAAKEEWARVEGKTNGEEVVIAEVNHYIRGNTTPQCPGGGSYTYNVMGRNPTCSVTNPTVHKLED
jgi:hypothetical protein